MPAHTTAVRESGSHASKPFFGSQPTRSTAFFEPPDVQRMCTDCESETKIQRQLDVGSVDDPLEGEADAMADHVVRRKSAMSGESSFAAMLEAQTNGADLGANNPPAVQRKCAACEAETRIQPQLEVGRVDDPLELEADRMADRVVRRQAADDSDDEREAEPLQAKALDTASSESSSTDLATRLADAKGSGAPLAPHIRDHMEEEFGADFSDVRVHTGAASAAMSEGIGARAFTYGTDIHFNDGEFAPGTDRGAHLLAHELTHVVQQNAGDATGLQAQSRSGARALPDVTGLVRASRDTAQALLELTQLVESTGQETDRRRVLLADLRQRQTEERAYADALEFIAQNPGATGDPSQAASLLWLPSTGGSLVSHDLDAFFGAGQPLAQQIRLRTEYHRRLLTLLQLVQSQVRDLAARLTAVGADPPDFVRETFHIVISHYVRLVALPLETALVRLTFLATYYANASVLNWYALSRHIAQNVQPFYESLRATAGTYVFPATLAELRASAGSRAASTPREEAERRAAETIRNLDIITAIVGEPPSSPAEVTATYLPANPGDVVEMFLDAHALIAVLALWKPLDALSHLLTLAIYAGTSITGLDADDRSRWEREMTDLRGAFMDETRARSHPDLATNIEPWRARVQRLIDEIPQSVRRRQIAAAVATEIPFLFVGGATVLRVGLWVSRITRGSRLLIALAEGATMTVLNFAATPPGAPGRPSTAAGWIGQFAVNTALAFFGRLIFQGAGFAADRLAQGRGVLVQLGARVGVPIVGITALQTAAQAVQERVRRQGGETNYTEMFTLNLLLNGIGILLGAATLPPSTATEGAALATRPGTAPVRPTSAELARTAGIPEDVARQLLEIGDRLDAYNQAVAAIQEAASRGTLTEAQFEAMRRQALDLIDFLAVRVPVIAAHMAGRNVSASSISVTLAAARARVAGATYSARPTVLALLPEATPGLTRVGQSDTWVYPREQPPERLPALQSDYERRGHTVRALPGGGWEALPPGGGTGVRFLPVGSSALASLPPSIESIAAGPQAQAGLAQIRAQAHVTPELLEADLAAAASGASGARAAVDVLQQLRLLNPDLVDSWKGLETYLRLGGDLPTLRRAIMLSDRAQMAAEQRSQVIRVLAAMRGWNAETLRGLRAVLRLRPRTTTAELGRLLVEHPAGISEGVLHSIAVLEPDSRGLGTVIGAFLTETTAGTAALSPQQIGALGSLRTGIELRARYPGQILSFEERQLGPAGAVERVVDINVYERQTRRVAGREQVTERLTTSVEVKEVTRQSLGRRAPHQLAVDIVRDFRIRAGRVTPVGASRPFFETLRWRIRRAEFEQDAMQRVGAASPQDLRVEPEMRRVVQTLLEGAFADPVMNQLPPGELDGYRRGFTGVPFVEFF